MPRRGRHMTLKCIHITKPLTSTTAASCSRMNQVALEPELSWLKQDALSMHVVPRTQESSRERHKSEELFCH